MNVFFNTGEGCGMTGSKCRQYLFDCPHSGEVWVFLPQCNFLLCTLYIILYFASISFSKKLAIFKHLTTVG